MKHYTIVMVQRNTYRVEVEAETEDEAFELALDERTIDNIEDSTLDWIDIETCYDSEEGEENGED